MSFLSFFPQIPTVTTASAAPVYHGGMIPCLGDVEPVNTRWLIKGYFPMGAVSFVAGPGGVGKGVFMADVVAAVTTGRPTMLFPDAAVAQGNVLVLTSEDDPGMSLAPRMIAAEADMRRVFYVTPSWYWQQKKKKLVIGASLFELIVEDYKTVPGWDNPYIQNHVVQPLQGALAVQDVELAYELPDAYFHIQTCEDGFDYTLYNKDFTERDGGILETDEDKPVQEAMTELLAEFSCDAAEGKVMDAAELREQADAVAEQQAEVLKEKLAAERPAPEETLSFYVAECLEFTFAGEFHDHLTMEEALEAYDKIPSERMNADKCIGFCIEEDGGFVGMYELVVNDKVQRENINSINYFRDDKLVQQAISDMEKLMAARQQSKEQERGSTKKSVLDALRSLKAKKQEQPAQEQDKPKKAKKKGMEL